MKKKRVANDDDDAAAAAGEEPFYLEQKRWPFAHAISNIALYQATRDPVLSLLLAYVWETLEFLLSLRFKFMKETMGDKMVGDIGVGFLSIWAFWVIDKTFGFDEFALAHISPWKRSGVFVSCSA